MLTVQNAKTMIIAVIACFFSVIVFNNITDYSTNHWCVQSVLSMENVKATHVMWRAVKTPEIVTAFYVLIIMTEALIALLCWLSVILTLLKKEGRRWGLAGLMLGFVLFMLGFVVVAGEWFYMWQHPTLAGLQQKAAIFALVMLGSMAFVAKPS